MANFSETANMGDSGEYHGHGHDEEDCDVDHTGDGDDDHHDACVDAGYYDDEYCDYYCPCTGPA